MSLIGPRPSSELLGELERPVPEHARAAGRITPREVSNRGGPSWTEGLLTGDERELDIGREADMGREARGAVIAKGEL